MRILDAKKIPYEAKEYDDDGEHPLAKGAANRTAEKLGIDPKTVYKTIVMRTDTKELVVFLQSSLHEIKFTLNFVYSRAIYLSPQMLIFLNFTFDFAGNISNKISLFIP